jgi:hypothetical protein
LGALCSEIERTQAGFFQSLNLLVEPWVRAGFGSPGPWPTGAIVLETRGRRTGHLRRLPLLAMVVGDLAVVSTVRRPSQWVDNLIASGRARYWIHGRAIDCRAVVVSPFEGVPREGDLPEEARALAVALGVPAAWLGVTCAILMPLTPTAGAHA